MTLLQRLNNVRKGLLEISTRGTASGYNFKYADLEQIEPDIVRLCEENMVTPWITFPTGKARLELYASEDMTIAPLVTEVDVDRTLCHIQDKQPIQNVGGMMTYCRRYLYYVTFMISDHDAVEEAGVKMAEQEAQEQATQGLEKAQQMLEDPIKQAITTGELKASDFEYSEEEQEKRAKILEELILIDGDIVAKMLDKKKVPDVKNLATDYLQKVLAAKKAAIAEATK